MTLIRRFILSTLFVAGLLTPGISFAAPKIIGLNRFANDQDIAANLLISELNCTACHLPKPSDASPFPRRPGPSLTNAIYQAGFLEQWIMAPHTVKPGTVMPDLLADHPPAQRIEIAENIASYLRSISSRPLPPSPRTAANATRGKQLFFSIGCAACHHLPSNDEPTDNLRISLLPASLSSKYTLAGMTEFLTAPAKVRPSHRMPKIKMDHGEARAIATFLTEPFEATPIPATTASTIQKGKHQFQSLGCVNCHQVSHDQPPAKPSAIQLESVLNSTERGCLSPTPSKGTPYYNLSPEQRTLLKNFKGGNALPPTPQERIETTMAALNCYACHRRGEHGGVAGRLQSFFTSTGQDLGDEGRFPPNLTGVGRKLTPSSLRAVLQGQHPIRPFMKTRMPDFGAAHAARLTQLLMTADHDPKVKPTPRNGRENQVGRNMWGRGLIGQEGLGCITCHPLGGNKSLGIQSIDLSTTTSRLQPEWFRDFLINPAHFKPGTRMPSFWPDGKPSIKKFINSTERQIDSLWVYLNELEQSRLPAGMERSDDFVLVPRARPIVFRTFMEHAGLHAIAVGYQQGLHIAFDSKKNQWATVWKGAFLDAESTWDNRFTPLTKPLGTNVVRLPPEFPFHSPQSNYVHTFQGYKLSPDGTPTFLYRFGPWNIEDQIRPSKTRNSLSQHIVINGPSAPLTYLVPQFKEISVISQEFIVTSSEQRRRVHFNQQKQPLHLHLEWTW